MPKQQSSVFSFDTLRLNGHRPAGFFRAIAVTLALLVLAELVAHFIVRSVGRQAEYWDEDPAVKLEAYQRHIKQNAPEIVIVGDSTAALDIDPGEMGKSLPDGVDVYNLALPGSFPMAFRCTNLPFLNEPYAAPKLVIVSFSPAGFSEHFDSQHFEDEILGSAYCRCSESNSYYDVKCLGLTSALRAFSYQRKQKQIDIKIEQELSRKGFDPVIGAKEKPSPDTSRGNDNRPRTEVSISSTRFGVIQELARIARQRHFKVIFVIPPENGTDTSAALISELNRTKESLGIIVSDYSHSSFLSAEHYYDNLHLNADGAKIYSKELGKLVAAYYQSLHAE